MEFQPMEGGTSHLVSTLKSHRVLPMKECSCIRYNDSCILSATVQLSLLSWKQHPSRWNEIQTKPRQATAVSGDCERSSKMTLLDVRIRSWRSTSQFLLKFAACKNLILPQNTLLNSQHAETQFHRKMLLNILQQMHVLHDELTTSGYATWFTAGGAIRIGHYDVIDDVITQKL